MKFKTRTVIEITDHAIKIVQSSLAVTNTLVFAEIVPFENMSDDGVTQELLKLQKDKKLNLHNSQIILLMPRQYAILRYLDLPSQNLDELKNMVDLQAVNHIPYAREEVVVDYLLLDKASNGYSKVLVMVVPQEAILRFWRVLEGAHMSPHKVTVSFIGLWQWYQQRYPAADGVAIVMDIDSHRSEICLCDRRRLLMSRPTTLGIKEIDAQQWEEFTKQLDWTMTSYVKEKVGAPVSQVILLSSLDSIEALKEHVQKEYSIPVQSIRTLEGVTLQKTFSWPKLLLQQGPSITSALGLLTSQTETTVDLIPSQIKAIRSQASVRRQWTRIGIIGFIALVGLIFCFSLNFLKQNTILSNLQDQIKDSQREVTAIKQKKHQVALLKNVVVNRVILVDIIGEIYRFLPRGIVLTNLTFGQQRVLSLQGYSTKASDVNDLQKSFVDSAYFDNVNLDYANKRITQSGEVNYFRITAQIKTKGGLDE